LTLLRLTDAAHIAERYCLKEARAFDYERRSFVLESYRDALGRQLLTPAPDVAAVIWKRQHKNESCLDIELADIEKAIAEDVAFLEAHPTRKARSPAPAD
jgi:hypothetical protein